MCPLTIRKAKRASEFRNFPNLTSVTFFLENQLTLVDLRAHLLLTIPHLLQVRAEAFWPHQQKEMAKRTSKCPLTFLTGTSPFDGVSTT